MKISISVKPNSGRSAIQKCDDENFLVYLKSAPINGKANRELTRLLAKHFRITQSSIVIKHGNTGKKKIIELLEN